jgi:hypothetical protein
VGIVILTSWGAYVVGTRGMGLRQSELPAAVTAVLSYLGLTVVFLLGNVAVGIVLILGLRVLTRQFISIYVLNDATLAVLSLLQALVFHSWRERST